MNTNKLLLLVITILTAKSTLGFGHLASTAKRYRVIAGITIAYHQTTKQIRLQKSTELNQARQSDFEQITKEPETRPILKSFNPEKDSHFILNCFNQDPTFFGERYYYDEADIDYFTRHAHTVILIIDGAPVGFGMYQYGHVNYLGIDQKYRGRGYSTILLNHMIKEISRNGYRKADLYVSSDNQIAINLYQKNGFKCNSGHKWLRCKLDIDKKSE